jgi:alcohol dehydrogenase (cytochrome c)
MMPLFHRHLKTTGLALQSAARTLIGLGISYKPIGPRVILISVAIVLVAAMCPLLFLNTSFWQSLIGPETASSERIWRGISCRTRIFLDKARGEISDISWTELWALSQVGSGFHCIEGRSLEASLEFSSIASEEDRSEGARIFSDLCAVCHGSNGSGGPHAPSLTRSQYKHGDSDLVIYKLLRDGIPGTSMPSARLPLKQLLQVTARVKMLQANLPESHNVEGPRLAIQVSSDRLKAAGNRPDEWLMYSGSYDGWHHTPLAEITPANVAMLRLRWIKQFDSNDEIIESTPLVIGGVIFVVAPTSTVSALDSKSGDVVWEYKRTIPTELPLCCGRNNRGLAIYGNIIFFGTLDGYLVALNASDGKVIWQTLIASPADGYSITGAPLVINSSVVVGIAGGEYGIRGFLAAYDASTGKQQWKFATIPGPGEVGHETWENDAWRTGGGPTWTTGSYDPSIDMLYWGVGNPSPPFSGDVRPGDNLFTDSVIALHAKTGKLAWYFQFTPHDVHDWDATQTPILADLSIKGVTRKVICWANRNGFYYVLDRVTGEFLAGLPFVEIDWASGLTPAGRPILTDAAKVSAGRRSKPGVDGGTNWQNAAFDPKRGMVFVPASEGSSVFTKRPANRVVREPNGLFVGSGFSDIVPPTRVVRALDAATGQRRWEYFPLTLKHEYSGLLSTEGGLVFGASGGICFALDAATGREVWRLPLGGTTKSAPISFAIDGQQMIAVVAGRAIFVFGL